MLRFDYAARTHVGLIRDNNEDSCFAGPYLLLVADGVGGAAAGEVASATTTYVVSALALARPSENLVDLLTEAVQEAHRQLNRGVMQRPNHSGMATTLTAVITQENRFAIAHIGDSRG